jgi:hypothetical protein
MSKFTFNLSDVGKSAAAFETSLASGTRNEDLTYTGDDYIVWDRVNGERLRRGLPSLADIGSPRPPPDANESTVTPSNKPSETFEVKGPPGLTLEQARAAFDQQVKTGSLVGLKPGTVLSAASQAAAGLSGAQAILAQAQSGITGALGSSIPGAAGTIGSLASRASSLLTVGSVAATTLGKISQTVANTPVTAPVDLVNYARQAKALTAIGSMDQGTVTGVLAQTKNIVGQASNVVGSKGVGAYGFDISQLENAGVIKPGVSATFNRAPAEVTQADIDEAARINSEGGDITPEQVARNQKLNSFLTPAVFTGKDGIKSTSDILSNPTKQDQIQQQLMSQGVNQLSTVGIPVNLLSAQGLAGVATNAAKSVAGTEALLKNLPTPPSVPPGFTEAFNTNIRDGAFAANFSETKVPSAFKAEVIPVPAEQTVQRPTVDAASTRVIGNDKVPKPTYTAQPVDEDADTAEGVKILELLGRWGKIADQVQERIDKLSAQVSILANQNTITEQQFIAVDQERNQYANQYNTQALPSFFEALELYNASSERIRRALANRIRDAQGFNSFVGTKNRELKERIAALNKKIAGASTT